MSKEKQPTVIEVQPNDRKKYRKQLTLIGDGNVGREVFFMLKSRYKILYLRSPEEVRSLEILRLISLSEGYDFKHWDISRGMIDGHSGERVASDNNEIHDNPVAALDYILNAAKADNEKMDDLQELSNDGHIYALLDFHPYLDGMPLIERKLKEFAQISSVCYIVIIAPVFQCPPSLNKEFTLLDIPYPSNAEIKRSLQNVVDAIPPKYPNALGTANRLQDDLVAAARGLTTVEAENAFAKSLVKTKTFDIPTILEEKRQIIKKGGILECLESRFTFDQIGGLEALKEWFTVRRLAFAEDAAEFGLDHPKGALLIGVPGTGKSMSCDALANMYQMPLLRMDMGAIFGSHVGESEANMRNAISQSEAIAPAILWIDEVEKGIGGVQSSNVTDGGVTNRVFGTLLTWLQEKQSPVFVICTANDIMGIPPEFMRAGRFDEVFFLDLPDDDQRKEVIECILLKKHRNPDDFDLGEIVASTQNFSPAEIDKGVNNALFSAFADNKRALTTKDVVLEMGQITPLFNSRREEIEKMREWALGDEGKGGRARKANAGSKVRNFKAKAQPRSLDLTEEDL